MSTTAPVADRVRIDPERWSAITLPGCDDDPATRRLFQGAGPSRAVSFQFEVR
jgi:hypothetical protein